MPISLFAVPPSADLVDKVRDLYHTRVSDVRFLIPVLNGLTKKEVISALPKLIKLNPIVVKEVFNRLLGTHNNDSGVPHTSPVTPAELLIALHNIEPSKAELKIVIKGKYSFRSYTCNQYFYNKKDFLIELLILF